MPAPLDPAELSARVAIKVRAGRKQGARAGRELEARATGARSGPAVARQEELAREELAQEAVLLEEPAQEAVPRAGQAVSRAEARAVVAALDRRVALTRTVAVRTFCIAPHRVRQSVAEIARLPESSLLARAMRTAIPMVGERRSASAHAVAFAPSRNAYQVASTTRRAPRVRTAERLTAAKR
jgi:hypothetical protein